jgi:hypothetical protein
LRASLTRLARTRKAVAIVTIRLTLPGAKPRTLKQAITLIPYRG